MKDSQDHTTLKVTPKELEQKIKDMHQVRQPLYCQGGPGQGKSSIFADAAMKLGLDFVDLRGIPYLTDAAQGKMTSWAIPDMFPKDPKSHGIVLIDELPTAAPSVQTAFYSFINDRRIGDYVLPDGWTPMAAGNRAQDHGATYAMPVPLRNRFCHVELESSADDWLDWARTAGVNSYVTSFIDYKRDALTTESSEAVNHDAFATPRSWTLFARSITAGTVPSYSTAAMFVGTGNAQAFKGFLDYYQYLPKFKDVVADPLGTAVPPFAQIGVMYALAGMLGEHAAVKNLTPVMQYLNRLPIENQVMSVKEMASRDARFIDHPSIEQWLNDNKSMIQI